VLQSLCGVAGAKVDPPTFALKPDRILYDISVDEDHSFVVEGVVISNCSDCPVLAVSGPYTSATLPSVPGDGATESVWTPGALVKTRRGDVPICEVVVGDEVWTHRARWRRVLKTWAVPSTEAKTAFVVRTDAGEVGLTGDHGVLTPFGWMPVAESWSHGVIGASHIEPLLDILDPEELGTPYDHSACLMEQPALSATLISEIVNVSSPRVESVGILPRGSQVFDLEVEEDRTFTIAGLPVQNCRTNCACHLEFVGGKMAGEIVPLDDKLPFVDTVLNPPGPPPGFRLPTDPERLVMRDAEQRLNYARRMIAQTKGTPAQAKWIQRRRAANKARIDWLDKHKVWDPPKLDVGQVIRGGDVSKMDVRELTKVRGLDGRTVHRADVAARADALAKARTDLQATIDKMPAMSPGEIPDVEAMMIKAGAPAELFAAFDALDDLPPERAAVNAVGWGARKVLRDHLVALEVLGAGGYPVDVGPYAARWPELVLAGGTWISGPPADVAAFVAAWKKATKAPKPALVPWTE